MLNDFLSWNSFIVPPIPSTGHFPWEDAKKFQDSLIPYFSSNQGIVAAMKWFLKWLLGPSDHNCKTLTILLTSSDTNLSIRIITKSFMWLKLPETTITDLQISWHQTTEVNTLLAFYSNVLIALRLTIRLKNSLQSQLGEQQCYGYPSAYFYDLHLFLCFWLLFLYKAMQ